MPIVADASVAIRGDMSGFNADLKKGEAAVGGFAGRIRNLLSPRNVIGAAGLFGVGLGVRQLVGFAADAAGAYAELEQTIQTVDEIFGASADVIHDWGETAAETAGMSQQTFMSSAAIMGQTLQNMGFTVEESADRTTQLLQRAADLAIAYGKRPQDALLAITAAMRGERDTIEKFGVAIKQVDVNAEIAALGLDTSTSAALKNAQAVAVVNLLLQQSANSADRFAESSDSLAAQQATLNAQWDDFVALDVGDAVAGIERGAIKVGTAVGNWRAPMRDALDSFAMFFGPQRTQVIQAAEDMGIGFEELRQKIAGLMEGGKMTFEDAFDQATGANIAKQFHEEGLRYAANLDNGIKAGLAQGKPSVMSASQAALADPIIVAMLGGKEEAERIAGETPGGIAQALLDAQFEVADAAAELVNVEEQALTPMKERSQIIGFLSSKALADALNSNKPAVEQRARELKETAEARLAELEGAAFFHGLATAQSYAAGMNAGYGYVYSAATGLAAATRNQIGINSEPKDPNSPLRGITTWGGNIVKTMAQGIYGELGTASGAAAALSGALVPSFSGGATGMGAGVAGTVAAGNTYVLHVNGVQYEVHTPKEIIETLNMLAGIGDEGPLT